MAENNYSESYKEIVFYKWMEGNRKLSPYWAKSLPPDETGKIPSYNAVAHWRDQEGWIERADALDAEVAQSFQANVITKRTQMYDEHAELANKLIEKARDYLLNHEIDSMADALKAASLGVDIARMSVGQGDLGRKLMLATPEQLTRELNKLLGTNKEIDDDIIDANAEE